MDLSGPVVASSEQVTASQWVHSNWFRFLLLTALSLGIFFRVAGLGHKMYSHDEIYTSMYAAGYRTGDVFSRLWDGVDKSSEELRIFLQPAPNRGIADVASLLAQYSPHQSPLFFVLEHWWMTIFGHTPAAMRGLPALFGCVSILAMYWLGKELFQSSRIALLSTALFSVSPFHIHFAQDARPYSLWTMITLLSSAALLQAMRKNTIQAWALYSLAVILGVYTHQLFILVALVHGSYFVSMQVINRRQNIIRFLTACSVAVLFYLPWLYFVITRWQQAAQQVNILTMQTSWFRFIQRWILLFSSPLIDLDFNSNTINLGPYFLRVLILTFVAYAFILLLKQSSQQEKLFLSLVYLITTGILIAFDLIFGGMRSITGRYFVPANIATVLVVAYVLSAGLDQARIQTRRRWISLTVLLMIVAVLSNLNSLLADTWWDKELSRVQAEFVREIDKDETLLIVTGYHLTNLGDVLLLGLQVDSNVLFRLDAETEDVDFTGNYRNKYWFPASYEEFRALSEREHLLTREVLQGTLWRIDGIED